MEKAPENLELISRWFADFSPEQWRQLAALEDVYREWNEKINVISRKDIGSLYEKHVLHSLAIAAAFDLPDGAEVIDIGTGGGFPGIPLAIYFPKVQFHLVDSIGKKLKVVEAVCEAAALRNVSTQHIRAEEIKGRKFDVAVSRAVAPLKDLWSWSRPLLKKGPTPYGLICLKGGDISAEVAESGCRPEGMEIREIFPLEWFREKYLLYVPNP
jgi:16S rRNA (guanine527-N7)-methyltransferase